MMKTRLLGFTLVLLGGLLQAQGPPGGTSPFLGSVPQGKATGEETALSLSDAIAEGSRTTLALCSPAKASASREARALPPSANCCQTFRPLPRNRLNRSTWRGSGSQGCQAFSRLSGRLGFPTRGRTSRSRS